MNVFDPGDELERNIFYLAHKQRRLPEVSRRSMIAMRAGNSKRDRGERIFRRRKMYEACSNRKEKDLVQCSSLNCPSDATEGFPKNRTPQQQHHSFGTQATTVAGGSRRSMIAMRAGEV